MPNAETIAAIEEGRAMMRGEIPSKLYNSFEEMLADLDSDDDD
jgi:CRISPR/Cas system CSM-associated protein Csm2 small subunit